jgi:hypothetical protein
MSQIKYVSQFGEYSSLCIFYLDIKRGEDRSDIVPIICSEHNVLRTDQNIDARKYDVYIEIEGSVESIKNVEGKNILNCIFADKITAISKEKSFDLRKNNYIKLSGILSEKPTFNESTNGNTVANFAIEVVSKLSEGRIFNIHCYSWNKNAAELSNAEYGNYIVVDGQIKSRELIKQPYQGHICNEISCRNVTFQEIKKN